MQRSPGVFDERVFRGLDWLLAQAAARGLRLLLVLTNYWKDYGGMRQYVAWAAQQRGVQVRVGAAHCCAYRYRRCCGR
jgi:mannan endo-1,4-beta-mannosidase